MSSRLAQGVRAAAKAPQLVLIGLVRLYQSTVSPLLGPRCKYYPSCSHYGLEALRRHGAVRGSALAAWRVARCNPWSHGGVDDVPELGAPLFARRATNTSGANVSNVLTQSSPPIT